jgi:uncharacterized protein (TIGR03067 family)
MLTFVLADVRTILRSCLGTGGEYSPRRFIKRDLNHFSLLDYWRMLVMGYSVLSTVCLAITLTTFTSSPAGKSQEQDLKGDAIKKDLKQLEGTWELVFIGKQGKEAPLINKFGEGRRHMTILPDGSAQLEGKPKEAPRVKYRLDPTAKPKTVDLVYPPNQVGIQAVAEGIYTIVGDEWKMCFATVDHPRPTDFTYARGSGRTLQVYRRVKEKK